jgi:CYTH domain-containing protein
MNPKYSIEEIERRWLVDLARIGDYQAFPRRTIQDRYLSGTGLRLRKIQPSDGEPVYKLGKKYGKGASFAEPITNIYLSPQEYAALVGLDGRSVRKVRYAFAGGSLDMYSNPNDGLAIFELEFPSLAAADSYVPPPFVREEITDNPHYSGAALAFPL